MHLPDGYIHQFLDGCRPVFLQQGFEPGFSKCLIFFIEGFRNPISIEVKGVTRPQFYFIRFVLLMIQESQNGPACQRNLFQGAT